MKFCTRCNETKPLTKFYKQKGGKDGFHAHCKVCRSKYYENNADKIRARQKIYRENNKDKTRARVKKYYENNIDKERARSKAYHQRPEVKDRRNKQVKERLKTDVNFRLKNNLRRRLHQALNSHTKSASTLALLGCSVDHLKKHLEKQFQPGMTWKEKGKIHIDHIIPCASFDLCDPIQQKQCFHYSNLQPLWAQVNMSKGDKELYNKTWIGTQWIDSHKSALTTVRSVTSL